jgi:hypothetical protein
MLSNDPSLPVGSDGSHSVPCVQFHHLLLQTTPTVQLPLTTYGTARDRMTRALEPLSSSLSLTSHSQHVPLLSVTSPRPSRWAFGSFSTNA